MKYKIPKLILLAVLLNFTTGTLFGQSFEGWITYKTELLNPDSSFFPDSLFQVVMKEKFGERRYIVSKCYYKNGLYSSEIDAGNENGFRVFNPKDKLVYSWQTNSDTAITVDSQQYSDTFIEMVDAGFTDTILGIPCKSVMVKSKRGRMTLWYNPDYFKIDAKYYQGYVYEHLEQIINRLGCLPLKTEQYGLMPLNVQTAIDYKIIPVENSKFNLPDFKVIIENPVN